MNYLVLLRDDLASSGKIAEAKNLSEVVDGYWSTSSDALGEMIASLAWIPTAREQLIHRAWAGVCGKGNDETGVTAGSRVLRKNVVRTLLGITVPAQSQRGELAEAELAGENAGFQGSWLPILPGWIEGRRAPPGPLVPAALTLNGRRPIQAARSSWYSWWRPPSTGLRLTVAPSGRWCR